MDHDTALLLAGAGIALVSSIATALASHLLALREDGIKRARDRADREAEWAREDLIKEQERRIREWEEQEQRDKEEQRLIEEEEERDWEERDPRDMVEVERPSTRRARELRERRERRDG